MMETFGPILFLVGPWENFQMILIFKTLLKTIQSVPTRLHRSPWWPSIPFYQHLDGYINTLLVKETLTRAKSASEVVMFLGYFFLQSEPPLGHPGMVVGMSQKDSCMADVDSEVQSIGTSCPWNTSSSMGLSNWDNMEKICDLCMVLMKSPGQPTGPYVSWPCQRPWDLEYASCVV